MYRASRAAASLTRGELEQATKLDPGNAEYHGLLGRYLYYVAQEPAASIQQYRAAVALNPYSARYWLDLASAYQVTGALEHQRAALLRAVEVDPKTPEVLWEAGIAHLVIGDRDQALRQFRGILESGAGPSGAALQLGWRATGDAKVMVDQVLPRQPEVYLAFLQFLMKSGEKAAAAQVWSALLELKQPIPAERAFPYMQYLIDNHEARQAAQAWQALAGAAPSLRAYVPSDNLMVNGGFREKILNAGFDWRYRKVPHVDVTVGAAPGAGGRSLAITFDGENIDDAGIFQFLPLQPDTQYEFSAQVTTEGLMGASGPRFAIEDAYNKNTYLLTGELSGTTPWRRVKAAFTTGPDTSLAVFRIARVPGNPRVRGKMWITDLQLTAAPAMKP